MNSKKRILSLLSLTLVFPLSGCFFLHPSNVEIIIHDFLSSNQENDDSKTYSYVTKTNYQTVSESGNYKTSNLTNKNIGLGYGYHYLPSTGDVKLLVIPIATQDYGFSSEEIQRIQDGFFGESSDTGWESVSSFYKKSSGGKLNITGSVSKIVKLNRTKDQLLSAQKSYSANNKNYTDAILTTALDALNRNNMDLSQYDSDSDGYIDAVWMVYACPYESGSDLFWAYTTWTSDTTSFDNVRASTYSWASVDFLTEKDYGGFPEKADAHTFIHETGHMMGLDDYYSYDNDMRTNYDAPAGGVDMMDLNIIDHDAYSKYLLNWYKPFVLTDEYIQANKGTITLQSFEDTGSSILIPIMKDGNNVYNGTPLDEYLILQYYTPTGLNQSDSEGYYPNPRGYRAYTESGVLVYHVNASIGRLIMNSSNTAIVNDGRKYNALPDYSEEWGRTYLYAFLYSNTKSYSYGDLINDTSSSYYRTRMISLLPAKGSKVSAKTVNDYGRNNCLFRTTSPSFKSAYPDFMFDDGTHPAYSFKVTSQTDKDCVLTFDTF